MFKTYRFTLHFLIIAAVILSLAVAGLSKTEVSMSVWGMPWEDYLYTDVSIPKFEKQNPDISVKFYRYEDYWTKLVTLYAAKTAPDVMREDHIWAGLHAGKNMLMSLDKFVKGPEGIDLNDFVDVPFKTVEPFADHIYWIPTDVNNMAVLSYNKTLFDEAGLSYPDYSWTLEDLENAAKRLTGRGKYGFLWELPEYFPYTMTVAMGGLVWDSEDPTRFMMDSPQAVAGLQRMQKWIFDDKIVPKVGMAKVRSTAIQMFTSGRLALFVHGGWLIPAIKRDAPNLKFGTTAFPRGSAERNPGGIATGCSYMMNKSTKHPQEAWRLLKYLTSKEGLTDYWGIIWVATPARYSVLESKEFRRPWGLEGKVPRISTEEEFKEKLQWHADVLQNKWFTQNQCGKYQYLVMPYMMDNVGKLIGLKRGDAESVLKRFASQVKEAIEREVSE